jgi:chromosome segregation ATPase
MRNSSFIIVMLVIAQIAFIAAAEPNSRAGHGKNAKKHKAHPYTSFNHVYDLSPKAEKKTATLVKLVAALRDLKFTLKNSQKKIAALKAQLAKAADDKAKAAINAKIAKLQKKVPVVSKKIPVHTKKVIKEAKRVCKEIKAKLAKLKAGDRKTLLQAHLTHLETLIDTLLKKKITNKQRADDLTYTNSKLNLKIKKLTKTIESLKKRIERNVAAIKKLQA